MTETSDSEIVSTRQRRIAQLAKQMPERGLTSLNQHLDLAWLREAYRRTRKDGAVGVDGQTAADYEQDLEGNLRSLLERAKSGTYWAPPVRRVHIPKGTGGETRPIGIPTDIVAPTGVTGVRIVVDDKDLAFRAMLQIGADGHSDP